MKKILFYICLLSQVSGCLAADKAKKDEQKDESKSQKGDNNDK